MKNLPKAKYDFLKNELLNHQNEGIITEQQYHEIMGTYTEKEGLNFIKVILTIGAVLVGLGILSFIASNWIYISNEVKLMIIVAALGCALFISYKTEEDNIKISKAFLYLGVLIYGAGIFLIGQMFQLGGTLANAFLIWAIGTMAVAFLFADKGIVIFLHALVMAYIGNSFNNNILIIGFFVIVLLYALNKYFNHPSYITFFNNIVSIFFIIYLFNFYDASIFYIVLFFFAAGLIMYYVRMPLNPNVFKLQGLIIIGVSGLFLTIDEIWREVVSQSNAEIFAIIFGICLLIYLLSLVRKQLLLPLVFTCGIILRYYFDTFYDFLPKSMFFIIGGAILLAFGIYFDRARKHRGGEYNERIL